jgi:hypothetical protein
MVLEKLRNEANVQDVDEFIEIFNTQEEVNENLFKRTIEFNEKVEISLV